jgi:hypothetical protein
MQRSIQGYLSSLARSVKNITRRTPTTIRLPWPRSTTWDAIIVTPQGSVYDRDAIQNWYADQFEQVHPKNQIDKVDPDSIRLIATAGDAVWMNGEWTRTIQGTSGDLIEVRGY